MASLNNRVHKVSYDVKQYIWSMLQMLIRQSKDVLSLIQFKGSNMFKTSLGVTGL